MGGSVENIRILDGNVWKNPIVINVAPNWLILKNAPVSSFIVPRFPTLICCPRTVETPVVPQNLVVISANIIVVNPITGAFCGYNIEKHALHANRRAWMRSSSQINMFVTDSVGLFGKTLKMNDDACNKMCGAIV
jgi:hypothetical protein